MAGRHRGKGVCSDAWSGTWRLMRPLGSGLVLSLVFRALLGVHSLLELFLLATENHLHPPERGAMCSLSSGPWRMLGPLLG